MKTALAVMLIILATFVLLVSSTVIPQLLLTAVYPATIYGVAAVFYFTSISVLGLLVAALWLVIRD